MRRRKPEQPWHAFFATDSYDVHNAEVRLVSGPRPYLSVVIDRDGRRNSWGFSGNATLRALARSILRETKPKRRSRAR